MGAERLPGAVFGVPRLLLRLEGAALFFGAAFFYWRLEGAWLWFAVLFLAPDLSFLAYLVSPWAGAIVYDAFHATLGPLVLLALTAWLGSPMGEDIALIWLAHVGFDRALGYGLKYATAFGDTHLGRIGKQT
jgi:uncharacterized protein DUF4260